MTNYSLTVLHTIFSVLYVMVLAHAILSWLPMRRSNPLVRLLDRTVEPLLRPFRRMLRPWRTGGLDLSPMLLIVSLWVVERIIQLVLLSLPAP